MSEPLWLPIEAVIETNLDIVTSTGEPHALLYKDLLESACDKAKNYFYYENVVDVVTLAVILLFGISRNHPFQQGNKRTGFLAAILFLEQNGYMLTVADTELVAKMVIFVIEGRLTEADFISYLQPYVSECRTYFDWLDRDSQP